MSDISLALDKRFAFISAMSSVVSLSIQVMELAGIATCSGFGPSGLELAIGISAFTSIFLSQLAICLRKY